MHTGNTYNTNHNIFPGNRECRDIPFYAKAIGSHVDKIIESIGFHVNKDRMVQGLYKEAKTIQRDLQQVLFDAGGIMTEDVEFQINNKLERQLLLLTKMVA